MATPWSINTCRTAYPIALFSSAVMPTPNSTLPLPSPPLIYGIDIPVCWCEDQRCNGYHCEWVSGRVQIVKAREGGHQQEGTGNFTVYMFLSGIMLWSALFSSLLFPLFSFLFFCLLSSLSFLLFSSALFSFSSHLLFFILYPQITIDTLANLRLRLNVTKDRYRMSQVSHSEVCERGVY